ncbi:TetR/AcrR family transcriptional regulator [Bifidobacterium lemurum]|uniref:TetR/AcrR family transcriptional regulator n=1 Tax=Bifidobacterium lemurum TaxID=1603886 RepID=UPI000932927C|nr:TetR/AcrR family transcriptional regulator [Bifidobacterium lemurum]QOL34530.1 TetR/AcrR family transcriptional regulator [Bifidobacterium lemurum]
MPTSENSGKRVRKSPEERKREILDASVRLISERGFNGISIQDVADEVGISKQGLLRYVGSKDNLLAMTYEEYYASSGTVEEFMESGLPGSAADDLRFPAYLRFLVRHNARRRMMVQLFAMLQAEALNPAHPLYEHFRVRHTQIWESYSQYAWSIPPQLGEWSRAMRPYVRKAMESMDGIQLRWLGEPPIDLYDEWLEFERMIFPSPLWDEYR